jgi:hypothetical protein
MNILVIFYALCVHVGALCAAVPLQTAHLADVEATSWYLIIAGFLAELLIMYLLLSHRESLIKILGVTLFMNAVSIFMSSVTVFGVDATATLINLPMLLTFVLTYLVGVATSLFVEVLIVQKIFPYVDRAKLIMFLALANVVSIAAGMYGVWITKF